MRAFPFTNGIIEPPPRASAAGKAFILITLGVVTIFPLLDHPFIVTAVFIAIAVLCAITREAQSLHIALFFGVALLVSLLKIPVPYPFPFLIALVIFAVVVRFVPLLRSSITWLHAGKVDKQVIFLMVFTIVMTSGILIIWHSIAKPDLSQFRSQIQMLPRWSLPFVALFMAVFIATVEEAIYRGIMMQALDSALGAGHATLLIQAIVFGVGHIHGFPNGVSGVILAGIYGLMLGIIRRRSGGMIAPWFTHIFADITIMTIIIKIVL